MLSLAWPQTLGSCTGLDFPALNRTATDTLPPSKEIYEMFDRCPSKVSKCPYHNTGQSPLLIHFPSAVCFLARPTETDALMHLIRGIRAQGQLAELTLHLADGCNVLLKDILIGMATFAMCILWNLSLTVIYSRLQPRQRYWMWKNINKRQHTHFCSYPSLTNFSWDVFPVTVFSLCLSFMFGQARPCCLGNKIIVIFSVKWL